MVKTITIQNGGTCCWKLGFCSVAMNNEYNKEKSGIYIKQYVNIKLILNTNTKVFRIYYIEYSKKKL